MNPDDRAEWARLCEEFETRQALYDQTRARHARELKLAYRDLLAAGSARDRFASEHPGVSDD